MHTTSLDQIAPMLPFLIPLVLVSLGLEVFALIDLFHSDRRVKGGNKLIWALVILLVSTFGPLIYLFLGREDL
jgi:Phospholipase_D-nuclease N-terminal